MAIRRGRGVAAINYPTGMNLGGDPTQALVHSTPTGNFMVTLSSVDLGQGMKQIMAQICAETIGVPTDRVTVDTADTDTGPHCMGTFASRGTHRAGNAVIRKVFDTSSNAWLELQWYLFGAAFMLAAAYTLKQNEHIRIDIVYGLFPRRLRYWIDLFGHVFFLMPFVTLMVIYFVPYVSLSFRSGEMSTNAGGLIVWPAKAILLAGFFLLFLQGISEIIKKIAIMRGLMEDPNPFLAAHEQAELEAKALADEVRS